MPSDPAGRAPAEVRRVFDLPSGLERLMQQSRDEGFGHLDRLHEEWWDGANRFDRDGEALVAAFANDDLVGIAGINRDPFARPEEKAGRIRRLFVDQQMRGGGIGRRLVAALAAHAGAEFAVLTVYAPTPAAAAFYESLGFDLVGRSHPRSHQRSVDVQTSGQPGW